VYRFALGVVLTVVTSIVWAQPTDSLKGELAAFEPFLGVWELNSNWDSGEGLYAIGHYQSVLGGAAVELRAWVRNPDGTFYERYRSVLRHEQGKGLVSYDLIHDGTLRLSEYVMDGQTLRTEWSNTGNRVKDALTVDGPNVLRWEVQTAPANSDIFTTAINAQWQRRTPAHLQNVLANHTEQPLTGRTAELAPMVGSWTLDATWADGRTTSSEATHVPGPGGLSLVSHTYPSDNGGPRYHRYIYLTIPGDEPRSFRFFRFSYDGTMSEMVHRIKSATGQPLTIETLYAMPENISARQSLTMEDRNSMRWLFDTQPSGQNEWSRRMDGVWRRAEQ